MARVHQRTLKIRLWRIGDNLWPIMERVEPFLRDHVQSWGSGQFKFGVVAEDTGGSEEFATVAEAKEKLFGSRHKLIDLGIVAQEDVEGDRWVGVAAVHVYDPWTTRKWMGITAEGPNETEVVGIATVTAAEVKAALREERKGTTRHLGRVVSSVVNHPWVAGIGASLFAAVLVWLWGW